MHQDYGIGRYDGLETIGVGTAPHDCLRLIYDGNEKLFLPVENIELLSRFGSDQAHVALDKLGGVSWQSRKAKMKQRIRDMAGELIRTAAARALREAPAITPEDGMWDEFCARFPFVETEDQSRAIADVLDDMASGRPMDRLVCGDVGFGKTEVALRAAFVAACRVHRWRWWCQPRCWPDSITARSPPALTGCRSMWHSFRAWSRPRKRPPCARG